MKTKPETVFQIGAERAIISVLMMHIPEKAAFPIVDALNAQGIAAHRMYLPPLYNHPHFASLAVASADGRYVAGNAPVAQKVALMPGSEMMNHAVFGLPFHAFLDESDVARLVQLLAAAGLSSMEYRRYDHHRCGRGRPRDCACAGQSGREVLVLEAENAIGTVTSARNSGVIHAGIYYKPGSLKARLCVAGRDRLYQYAAERGIPHRRCGKLIVATAPDQLEKLREWQNIAGQNGVNDLRMITAEDARAMEPEVACVAALHSPSTGIIDTHEYIHCTARRSGGARATLALQAPVTGRPKWRRTVSCSRSAALRR